MAGLPKMTMQLPNAGILPAPTQQRGGTVKKLPLAVWEADGHLACAHATAVVTDSTAPKAEISSKVLKGR